MKKLYFIFGVLLILLIGYAIFITYKAIDNNANYLRMNNNFKNVNSTLDSIKTKNGEYVYTINGLELTVKEFKEYNSSLEGEIKNLKLKLKNVNSVSKIEYVYVIAKDSNNINIEQTNDSCFKAFYDDDWTNFSENICMSDNKTTIAIDSLKFKLTDSLLIVHDEIYKGWWFWRKAIGTKLYVKSYNPYIDINKIESITFKK
jgi:hypothetical protein